MVSADVQRIGELVDMLESKEKKIMDELEAMHERLTGIVQVVSKWEARIKKMEDAKGIDTRLEIASLQNRVSRLENSMELLKRKDMVSKELLSDTLKETSGTTSSEPQAEGSTSNDTQE